MGAEWCVDYVKGSLLTDETASLPGPVEAERTVTQCGRRGAHAPICLPSLLSARKKCFRQRLDIAEGEARLAKSQKSSD